ncbi:restriction endonuclease subunit S [Paenibacillus sp. SN-8-1]|uniref:restriction endonuclease subunit S n=1 Tax=Paenibacillus sp. SN-8-1 TaxID=3435409 RepID=UPI003D9A5B64
MITKDERQTLDDSATWDLSLIPDKWEFIKLGETRKSDDRYSFAGGPFGSDLTSKEYTDSGVQIIQLQNILEGKFNNKYRIFTTEEKADSLGKCNIYPGEIVIAKMAEPVARACIVPEHAPRFLMASDSIRLSPDTERFDKKFLMYAINAPYFRKQAEINSTGTTRLRIGLTNLSNLQIMMPPLKEQQKISEILSTADEQIENTEQLIQKTKELKKSLMQQLLTKGIGHTEFKQTELGEIPVAWEICLLKDISCKLSIGLVTTMTKYYVDNGIPLIRNSDIKEGYISKRQMVYLDGDFSNLHESKKLLLDDIVTVHTGDIGTSALITKDLVGCHGFATLNTRVKSNVILPDYLMRYFNSVVAKQQFYNFSTGDGRNNLNLKDFENTKIVVPNSLQEQQKIAEILSTVDEQIDSYEKEKEKQIELKKGLMQQLLTGKLRVTV